MKYCFLRFPDGKEKTVTFSYDDGTADDMRLADTFNKYGLKATFNLMGSRVDTETGLTKEFIRNEIIAKGHEVANHGYEHRALNRIRPIERIKETLDSRLTLEREFGMIIRGMAYPDITIDRNKNPMIYEDVRRELSDLGIAYARCADNDSHCFELPDDFYSWKPTAHHTNGKVMNYIDEFLSIDLSNVYRSNRTPKIFFVWGHAFEFERNGNWDVLENICGALSGNSSIWYATNIEIYDYVTAFRSLIYSADGRTIYNPTLIRIWFDIDGTLYSIGSGETLRI